MANSKHVLSDQEQLEAVIRRVKRAQGQIAGVVKMLEEQRSCEEIVHQMSAVGKAMNTAAVTLIAANLRECFVNPKRSAKSDIERLEKLFTSIA